MGEKFSSALGQLCSSALPCQKKDGTFIPPFCCQLSTRSLRLEVLFADLLEVLCHANAQVHVRFVQALRHHDDTLDCRGVLDDDLVDIHAEVLVDLRGDRQTVEAILNLVGRGAIALNLVLDVLALSAKCGDKVLEHTDFVERKGNADLHDYCPPLEQ